MIDKNAWFMYGSGKPDSKPYILTYVFDHDIKPIASTHDYIEQNNICSTMATTCSIRKFSEEHIIESKGIPVNVVKKKNNITEKETIVTNNTTMDIETAKYLVSILSLERADNYEKWLDLGFCLHNIDRSLLGTWIEFSKKNPEKYQPGVCQDKWELMKNDDGLRLGSLHRWAREDNIEKYLEYRKQRSDACMNDSLTGTHYDIAKLLFELYHDQFVFVCSDKFRKWYVFIDHCWVICVNGSALRLKISVELVQLYGKKSQEFYVSAGTAESPLQKEEFLKKAEICNKIINRLKTMGFINSVMQSCEDLFLDSQFLNKLDANPNLLLFNNGVLDVPNIILRDGRPEDYISKCTGRNLIFPEKAEKDDDYMKIYKEVDNFFTQIQPEAEMKEYLLTLFGKLFMGI